MHIYIPVCKRLVPVNGVTMTKLTACASAPAIDVASISHGYCMSPSTLHKSHSLQQQNQILLVESSGLCHQLHGITQLVFCTEFLRQNTWSTRAFTSCGEFWSSMFPHPTWPNWRPKKRENMSAINHALFQKLSTAKK